MTSGRVVKRAVLIGATALLAQAVSSTAEVAHPAGAAAARRPALSISPAITELRGAPPMALPTLTVRNATNATLRIRAYPAFVGQALDGGLVPTLTRPSLRRAASTIRVAPTSFALPPGASAALAETWLHHGAGTRGSWAAVVVEAVPAVKHPRVRIRLLQALMLTLPDAPQPRLRISGVVARRTGRAVHLAIRVANPGGVHSWAVDGTLQLRRAGHTAAVTSRVPRVLFPHAARDYAFTASRPLAAGRYLAIARVGLGTAVVTRTFHISVPPVRRSATGTDHRAPSREKGQPR